MSQLDLFGPPPPSVRPADHPAALHRLAAALPASVRLGCASWSFPGWARHVYATAHRDSVLSREGLPAYAAHPLFGAVSLDRTYHAPIDAQRFRAYAEQAGDLRFVIKAHADCTLARFPPGKRYGARAGALNGRWLDVAYAVDAVIGPALEGLGERAAVVLFQFSPKHASELPPPAFAERLHRFLEALPAGPRYGVEIRDPRLFGPGYAEALTAAGAVHCYTGHPAMPTIDFQRLRLPPVHAPALLVRWNLAPGHTHTTAGRAFGPFDQLKVQTPRTRRTIAQLCRLAGSRGVPTYVIASNNAEGCAPETIRLLAEEITGLGQRG